MAAEIAMTEEMVAMRFGVALETVFVHANVAPCAFHPREREDAAAEKTADGTRVHRVDVALDPQMALRLL
jgi:hypothetical protein